VQLNVGNIKSRGLSFRWLVLYFNAGHAIDWQRGKSRYHIVWIVVHRAIVEKSNTA
jgi:hypothetical protein